MSEPAPSSREQRIRAFRSQYKIPLVALPVMGLVFAGAAVSFGGLGAYSVPNAVTGVVLLASASFFFIGYAPAQRAFIDEDDGASAVRTDRLLTAAFRLLLGGSAACLLLIVVLALDYDDPKALVAGSVLGPVFALLMAWSVRRTVIRLREVVASPTGNPSTTA